MTKHLKAVRTHTIRMKHSRNKSDSGGLIWIILCKLKSQLKRTWSKKEKSVTELKQKKRRKCHHKSFLDKSPTSNRVYAHSVKYSLHHHIKITKLTVTTIQHRDCDRPYICIWCSLNSLTRREKAGILNKWIQTSEGFGLLKRKIPYQVQPQIKQRKTTFPFSTFSHPTHCQEATYMCIDWKRHFSTRIVTNRIFALLCHSIHCRGGRSRNSQQINSNLFGLLKRKILQFLFLPNLISH